MVTRSPLPDAEPSYKYVMSKQRGGGLTKRAQIASAKKGMRG